MLQPKFCCFFGAAAADVMPMNLNIRNDGHRLRASWDEGYQVTCGATPPKWPKKLCLGNTLFAGN